MTTNITLKVDEKEIEEIIESLPVEFKLHLVEKLERETLCQRWDKLLGIIAKRLKKFPLTEEEISEGLELGRKEYYAKHSH